MAGLTITTPGFGTTGKFWAHEHWSLREPVDLVTFGKKGLITPDKAYRQFNTWMGDEARLIIYNAIVDEILRQDLLGKVSAFGKILYAALRALSEKYPHRIRNLRGEGCGTYISFDTDGAAALCGRMKLLGVNIGFCGKDTVRLRPMLVFGEEHIPRLVEAIEQAFKLPDDVKSNFATF